MNQPGENDKIILDSISACLAQILAPNFFFFFLVLALLVVKHCSKLSSYSV